MKIKICSLYRNNGTGLVHQVTMVTKNFVTTETTNGFQLTYSKEKFLFNFTPFKSTTK